MKNLFRNWAVRGLLVGSLITAPWAAIAAYNIVQNDNGTTGFLDSLSVSGIQPLNLARSGRVVRTTAINGTGPVAWAFDEKEYTLTFADLGTASSASLVIPTTGVIVSASLAWNVALASTSAVLNMEYATGAQALVSFHASAVNVSAFSLTATTTPVGGKVTDDIIYKAVNAGDMIGVGTDGGPSNAVPGTLTIIIRAPAAL